MNWAVLWPATLVFSLWQILVAGHLSAWEAGLMALVLGSVAQSVFIAGFSWTMPRCDASKPWLMMRWLGVPKSSTHGKGDA